MSMTPSIMAPPDASSENAVRIGVIGGLSATSMLFASLISAYLVRRSFPDWRASQPLWPFLMMALALGASVGVEIAARSFGAGRRRGWLTLSAMSLGYLLLALGVLVSIIVTSVGLTSPHRAFVFVLLGLHFVHAILGAWFSLWVLRSPDAVPSDAAMSLCRLVTHFLTALLVMLLFLLFVVQ